MKEGFVYIMSDRKDGIIYIGFTIDMAKRGWEHRNKLMDGFTQRYNLIRLVWFERHDSVEKASAMEKKLKNLHRNKKIEIIEKYNPEWRDLYPEIVPYDPVYKPCESQSNCTGFAMDPVQARSASQD